jgi:hypothetical protein
VSTSPCAIGDDEHEYLRDTGGYLCHCPQPRTRDPLCPQQCHRCGHRIHRRYDHELAT